MTVKCLDQNQKDFIAAAYRERVFESDELATMHGVSRRTIQRILLECGVARSRVFKGRKPRQKIDLPITMIEIDPDPTKPSQPVHSTPPIQQVEEPFIKRLWVFVKQALSFPFK